ncbi:MAG: hypothetical protein Q9157_006304, partial [Trypethelium eluteriae]
MGPPVVRPWAYRIENIPAGTTEVTLIEYFVPEDRPYIRVRSLVPSASHRRGKGPTEEAWLHCKLTATISFIRENAFEHGPKLCSAPNSTHGLTVDRDFYGFTPLHQPPRPDVEIVAVTGLAGHAFGSWATKNDYVWLRDGLPSDIKDARILSYGYPSELVKCKMQRYVIDHATDFLQRLRAMRASNVATDRPVVLIGHSLGCLIIKQALIDDAEVEIQSNRLPVACIVFLGAPHRGLDVRNLETLVAAKPPEDLIRELKPGSPTLKALNARFHRVADRVPIIISCYEKLPTPTVQQEPDGSWKRTGPEVMMVSEDSARLYLSNEISISASSNHSDIAKISPGEAGIYHPLVQNIRLALSSFQGNRTAFPSHKRRFEEFLNEHEEQQTWAKSLARDERANKFLQKLYTCPYIDRKERNCERIPGTCGWFTSHPRFQNWNKNQGSCLLWVSADPGCGKSVLAKYLVDQTLRSTSKRTTCYFFFKDDFPDQKSAANAVCAILRQLFLNRPHLLQDWILDRMDTIGDAFVQSFHDLWSIFTSVAANPAAGEIVCVLDALDECQDEDRSRLMQALGNLYVTNEKDFRVKFLLTSRPYNHIHRQFRKLENRLPTIHLSGEDEAEVGEISHEIDLVIKSRVEDLVRMRDLKQDEGIYLQEQLTSVDRRHRTYLWVHLTLDVLENMPGFTKGNVGRAIRQLPPTVDDAYEKILGRSPDIVKARRLLHIVTAATEPLSLKEVSLIMAIEETHRSYDDVIQELEPEERFRFTLRELCGLIVVIIDRKIYLLHQTVKEFLVRDDSSASSKESRLEWRHSLQPKASNRILAERCIWYLNLDLDLFKTDLSALLHYSARNWTTHFREASIRSEEAIAVSARRLCEAGSKQYDVWSGTAYDGIPNATDSFIIVSFHGLDALVKLLLETGEGYVDSKNERGRSSLSYAAYMGHEAVVKLLLETGEVDVNSKDKDGRSPLSYAAENGQEVVVKLLLETGEVELDSKDKNDQSPLSYAAEMGWEAVVKLLLKTGEVDVDSKDKNGRSPLSYAAMMGGEGVVKLLLETGEVDVDSKDKNGQSPLSYAAAIGQEAVIKLLLETGEVDINLKNKDGQSPLSWAAEMGWEAVIKLLLETGEVDINLKNKDGQSPLSWAAEMGWEAVVKLLLETGEVDIDSKDKDGRSPLSCAARMGEEGVVKLLLETGKVDANSMNEDGQTPLALAMAARCEIALLATADRL